MADSASLEEVCELIADCPHSTPVWTDSGVIVLRNQNIKGGRLDLSDPSYTDEFHYESRTRRAAPTAGDLVITREAPMGEICMIPNRLRCCLGQRMVLLRPDRRKIDGKFLLYALQSVPVQHEIRASEGTGSTVSNLRIPLLESLIVPTPPLSEQRAIAHILGTLDDKIELNRRMNETLEQIARALFKSWLVDFDPVHAKAEGRDPGLPGEIADLFPDSFEESELGEIPKGWEVRSLDEIARFVNGLALQKYPPKDGRSLPVIKIAQLRVGSTDGADRASTDLDPEYVVDDGDVLFSWSGSLECVLWAGGKGALNQHLFKVTSQRFPKWLYYLWIHEHLEDFRHIAAGKATTMGHIQRHHLSDAKTAIPPTLLVEAAGSAIGPAIESIWRRTVQSRALAQIRDAPLPKLISGELRVENGERLLEAGIS
jgi:type I restriction enzyme S subunit